MQGRVQYDHGTFDGGLGLGGALEVSPLTDRGCSGYGRPLRFEEDRLFPRLAIHRAERELDPTSVALADAWLDDTRSECGSVPAFLALARDLARAGAPRDLVARAERAAWDELRHTFLCAGLAERYGSLRVAAPIVGPLPARAQTTRDAIERFAIESWLDGCLGEGEAAARARVALVSATDAEARRVYAVIAQDEQRHADLAWDILAWALRTGGRRTKERVRAAMGGPADLRVDDVPGDAATWSAHGRLLPRDLERVREATYARSTARGMKLLDLAW